MAGALSLTHFFHVAIPSQTLTSQVFSYIFYLNYLSNNFISDFIFQSFPHIILHILISAVSILFSSSDLMAHPSAP